MSENVIAEGVVKLSASAGPLGAAISAALANIKKPLAEVKAAGESAGGSFEKAGGMVAAGLAIAGAAAIGFAVHSADTFKAAGLEVLKTQRYLGDTAQEASKWRFAAQQSGVSTDTFTRAVGLLSKGLGTGKIDLGKFGVAALDAHGNLLPMNDILLNVAAKMQSLPPGIDRTSLAMQIFGKSGAAMVPLLAKGRDGILALEAAAQKYGQVLTGSNMAAIQANLVATRQQSAAWQGLQIQIGENVLPVMTKLTTAFTEGLLKVMPTVSAIMNATVIPAFSFLTTVLGGTVSFLAAHIVGVERAAIVIGAVMVPAIVAWGVAQAQVAASNVIAFLARMGTAALDGAVSMGLLANADNYATVTMTTMGVAAAGVAVGIGLVVMQNRQMQDSANKAAAAVVAGAKSPQDAIAQLTALQAHYHKEMQSGVTILGQHITLTDAEAKAGAQAKKNYAAVTAQLHDLTAAQQQAGDASSRAADAIDTQLTSMGLKMQNLGGATKLTSDQVQQLADHLGIDLTKNSTSATAKLVDAAVQLGYTSVATQRLAADNQVLTSWMSNATDRTKAFTDAMDALVGTQVSAETTSIAFHQALDDTVAKLKGVKYSTDITTQAGRDQQTQIVNLVDATKKMIESDQNSGITLDQLRPKIASHVADLDSALKKAGLTKDQIAALNTQYELTPAALAQVTPAIDGQTTAWGNLTGSIAGTGTALDQLLAKAKTDVGNIAATTAQLPGITINAQAAQTLAGTTPTRFGKPHAAGGPVSAGVTYPVGEKGPELFTPDRAGTILPHGVLAMMTAASARQTTVVHHHHHYDQSAHYHVQGSLVTKTQLLEEARQHANRYNARAGVGR